MCSREDQVRYGVRVGCSVVAEGNLQGADRQPFATAHEHRVERVLFTFVQAWLLDVGKQRGLDHLLQPA
ncbi:hypothetical protein D3C81_1642060 [compost metagenome]